MAEAFAALSIAANIAQFVDYVRQLISGGKEIYNSLEGARDEHQALKVIIEDIKNLAHEHQHAQPNPHSSVDEKGFKKLAAECGPVADKLLDILKDLEVPSNARFRGLQTIRQTVRSAAKKKEIQDIQRRLADIDGRLRDRASRMLQKNNQSSITSAINTLTRTNERLKMNTSWKLEQLRDNVLRALREHGEAAAKEQAANKSLAEQLLALIGECKKVELQQKILESLIFEEMEQREENIKDAHKTTLDWIFKRNDTKFVNWLETENGIYWVRGKAGSGKSTLMKYISNHGKTLAILQNWARSKMLFTASFFFWNAGFRMQKSQAGLLQSLLYQVLRACPDLILEVRPAKSSREPWKRKELFKALSKVQEQKALSARFCFFIDGLDEYDGDNEEIIALLQGLASSPCVKICVSSRPENVFLDTFDNSKWKLVLEDLTKHDMRNYVHTLLVENEIFAKVVKDDPRCERLVPQIAEKAQGVWLWVYLVVRDILRDLQGEEEYPLLQRRLDSFPSELEQYFANIIDRIDKFHREETAKIFLVAMEAPNPIPLLCLKYLSKEDEDPGHAFKLEIAALSIEEVSRTEAKWTKLLNSRCRGLLEVRSDVRLPSVEGFHAVRVEFLHKSVRDFLRDSYQSELLQRAGDLFNAKLSLCHLIIAFMKISPNLGKDSSTTITLVYEMLSYARELQQLDGKFVITLLDELERIVKVRFEGFDYDADQRWKTASQGAMDKRGSFLALAVEAGLRGYVAEKLDSNRVPILQKRGRPLLDCALRPRVEISRYMIDSRMVRLLLERGADPNQNIIWHDHTVWSFFLTCCSNPNGPARNRNTVSAQSFGRIEGAWYDAIDLMIDHGADPNIRIGILQISNQELSSLNGSQRARYTEVATRQKPDVPLKELFTILFDEDKAARLNLRVDDAAQRRRGLFWMLFGWN